LQTHTHAQLDHKPRDRLANRVAGVGVIYLYNDPYMPRKFLDCRVRYAQLLVEPFRTALRLSIGQVRQTLPFTTQAWVPLPDHLHCIRTLPEDDSYFSGRWLQIKSRG
jgi:hypothetical protein